MEVDFVAAGCFAEAESALVGGELGASLQVEGREGGRKGKGEIVE